MNVVMNKAKQIEGNRVKPLIDELFKTKEELEQGGGAFIESLMKEALNAILEAEMEHHLGYRKHAVEGNNSGNSRNGKRSKKLKSDNGVIEVSIPRDRNSTFEPMIVPKGTNSTGKFEDAIISLYTRGMTTREIEGHLRELYDVDVSPSFISTVTSKVEEEVLQWQNRPLDSCYVVLHVDGIRVRVREDAVVKNKVFYLVLATSQRGGVDVLGIWNSDNEGAAFWTNVMNELKARGLEDVLLACVDGLKGLPEAIQAVFPSADIQLCVVHQIRTCCKFVPYKDRREFCQSLKAIYGAPTLDMAQEAMRKLEKEWENTYPAAVSSWVDNWDKLSTFFSYPVELRNFIYTTNKIENLNGLLRKNTKNRKVFPSADSVRRIFYLNIKKFSAKLSKPRSWSLILNQLAIKFQNRLKMEDMMQ